MKRLTVLMLVLFCLIGFADAQNPFEKYGYTPKIATLSEGRYNEFFDNDTIVQIGSVLYNTKSRQIVAFVQTDTAYSEATLQPDIVSRWLSPDPLAAKYAFISPYNFVANSPLMFIDPDGRDIKPVSNNDARLVGGYIETFSTGKMKADEIFGTVWSGRFVKDPEGKPFRKNGKPVESALIKTSIDGKQFEKNLKKSGIAGEQADEARALFKVLSSDKITEISAYEKLQASSDEIQSGERGLIETQDPILNDVVESAGRYIGMTTEKLEGKLPNKDVNTFKNSGPNKEIEGIIFIKQGTETETKDRIKQGISKKASEL